VKSVKGVAIRLTQERWDHIRLRHPELKSQKEKVLETIEHPGLIQKGDFGSLLAIRSYKETPLSSKFLVVVYREIEKGDGFVLTAYLTNRPSRRRKVVWKR
jgi:hypothetical protein